MLAALSDAGTPILLATMRGFALFLFGSAKIRDMTARGGLTLLMGVGRSEGVDVVPLMMLFHVSTMVSLQWFCRARTVNDMDEACAMGGWHRHRRRGGATRSLDRPHALRNPVADSPVGVRLRFAVRVKYVVTSLTGARATFRRKLALIVWGDRPGASTWCDGVYSSW